MILIPAVAEVVFQEFLRILKMKYMMMMIMLLLFMMIRISQDDQQELDRSQNGWKTLYVASSHSNHPNGKSKFYALR